MRSLTRLNNAETEVEVKDRRDSDGGASSHIPTPSTVAPTFISRCSPPSSGATPGAARGRERARAHALASWLDTNIFAV